MMAEGTSLGAARAWLKRWAPECVLACLAGLVFLGFLGSVNLWGKREQRASAEAIDTIHKDHWLVAQIQGRPRLEKPPLPRWTTASVMWVTGVESEWTVRLPSACAALGIVALVYAFGLRLGGRTLALLSASILISMVYFVLEMRQAGNDGPLAFFTTLAMYAAFRCLDGENSRFWARWMWVAAGLGFLCKGPIILLIVAVAILPALVIQGRFRSLAGLLLDGWGVLAFVVLALSWPVPVMLRDPEAIRVWYLEMAQKAGAAGVQTHQYREILALNWPSMTIPWVVVGSIALVRHVWDARRGRLADPRLWFLWCWVVLNLAMFCFWRVAKPNYFVPCLPAVAVLVAQELIRLVRESRQPEGWRQLRLLQGHILVLAVVALGIPGVSAALLPMALPWSLLCSVVLLAALYATWRSWRLGDPVRMGVVIASVFTFIILVVYGAVAPMSNPIRGHLTLARTLESMVPPDVKIIRFYHQIDEGLWFYLRGHDLEPVPGSQPKYNSAYDMVDDYRNKRLITDTRQRIRIERQRLIEWMARSDRDTDYVLILTKLYDQFGPELANHATPLLRETDLKRNGLVLLRVNSAPNLAAGDSQPEPASHPVSRTDSNQNSPRHSNREGRESVLR